MNKCHNDLTIAFAQMKESRMKSVSLVFLKSFMQKSDCSVSKKTHCGNQWNLCKKNCGTCEICGDESKRTICCEVIEILLWIMDWYHVIGKDDNYEKNKVGWKLILRTILLLHADAGIGMTKSLK